MSAQVGGEPNAPDLFVISHSGARAGAPMVLLRFLRWLAANTTVDTSVVLLHGGDMEDEFRRLGARLVGGAQSRLWMLQHGLRSMGYPKASSALAAARLGPPMWNRRNARLVLMNSVGSLPALRFMPRDAPGTVVLYVHELDESLEQTVGSSVWERESPRVDHFLTCSGAVTEMLVERKGIPADRITEQPGFVDRWHVEPLRTRYLRREMKIPRDAFVVGASGRLDWRKAPEVFVRVARTLVDRRPDLNPHFVWLGGPIDDTPGWKLRHDIDAAGLADRFHLPGETRTPAEVFSTFDVYALTSRVDPFPLTMLEAASLGVPIVSFANGGAVELAAAGGADPLIDIVPYLDVVAMAEAIARLLDEPDARRAAGARVREHVLSTHVTDVAAPRLFEILADLEPTLRTKGPEARPRELRGS